MELTVAVASYVAGAMDGEGSLAVYATKRTPTATPCHRARFTITNTKKEWLDTLQTWIGGTVYAVGQSSGRRNRKQLYRLELRRPQILSVLPQLYPYLLIKQPQAELLLEYLELAARRRIANGSRKPCDPAIPARIDAILLELKRLNLRGVGIEPRPRPVPQERLCALTKCDRPRYSNGYCRKHYRKYIERHGPTWHEINCAWCGKQFVAKRSDARFCSKPCSGAAYHSATRPASRSSSPAVPEATVQSQDVGDGS